jgi:ketosteroid isomerase-like protein
MMTVMALVAIVTTQLVGCASSIKRDLAHYPFPEAQSEIRRAVQKLTDDAINGDAEGIRAAHLSTDKFTKFAAGKYERIGFDECVDEEISVFTSAQTLKIEANDVKIDVFGDVAVLTEYVHIEITEDGEVFPGDARVTLVYVNTGDGWKIVHEHVSMKDWFEQ